MRHTRTPGERHHARGYTLIEVIVAFALLALALTLLLGTLSGAVRQVRWSGDAGRAALHAQSLIDQAGLDGPLRAGSQQGQFEDGRYRWTLDVAPWDDPGQPPQALRDPAAPRLMELRLAVEWADGRPRERLQMRTLRLVPAGPEAALP